MLLPRYVCISFDFAFAHDDMAGSSRAGVNQPMSGQRSILPMSFSRSILSNREDKHQKRSLLGLVIQMSLGADLSER
jgi:hypothetical protein